MGKRMDTTLLGDMQKQMKEVLYERPKAEAEAIQN